jgi:hypothetical protein
MLIFSSEADLKDFTEHSIVYAGKQIKFIEGWIKTQKEWLEDTSDAEFIKSIRSGITKSEDAIKEHRRRLVKWRQDYKQRYGYEFGTKPKRPPAGKTKLTVIYGKADGPLTDEFGAFLQKAKADQHLHE